MDIKDAGELITLISLLIRCSILVTLYRTYSYKKCISLSNLFGKNIWAAHHRAVLLHTSQLAIFSRASNTLTVYPAEG